MNRKIGEPNLKTDSRERIVRAAARLFQEKGYHGAGLTEILSLAQAPKGSMYHHFPGGKESLALAALEWLDREVSEYLDAMLESGEPGSGMATGMAEFCSQAVDQSSGMRGTLVTVLAQDCVPGSQAVQAALAGVLDTWSAKLEKAFRAEGKAQPDLCAQLSLSLLEGAMITARIRARPELVKTIVQQGLSEQACSASRSD